MDPAELLAAVAIGFAAGAASGLLGVGGGILFVPGLVIFLDQTQLEAEATSLLAIVPVAIVGVWRQRGYDNVRLREGLWVGVLSVAGVAAGSVLANVLPGRGLTLLFAGVQLLFAFQLARRALREEPEASA